MLKDKSRFVLIAFLIGMLAGLTVSCAKKVVQEEETVAPKEEIKPAEKPTPPVAKVTPPPRPTIKPTEEALADAERKRKEDEAIFSNKDIHFDFDRYDLKPEAREILADKAYFLRKYPDVKILIEGHCDERGTNEYNLALGERRANSARQYLILLGIAENRINSISYGEERPLDPASSEEAWARNRRAHFEVISR